MNAICFTFSLFAFSASSSNTFTFDRGSKHTQPTNETEEPLYLTPFINAGNFSGARTLSRVVPPLLNGVESYTGFLTVNKTAKAHLYFWFIPKTISSGNETTPLIVWLQGGPGRSSLYGLFNENGPFQVSKSVSMTGSTLLEKRQYAWTEHYHMLYIDQPIGTGFSFTENRDGYDTSEFALAKHLYDALAQFYKIFPDLRSHDLYLAGESYAGKYIPAFGYEIHTANSRRAKNAVRVPLKGMMIGNGISDPESLQEYAAQARTLGLIDEKERASIQKWEEAIRSLIRSGRFSEAYHAMVFVRDHIKTKIGLATMYDYTRDSADVDESYVRYLSQDSVRKRIHVGGRLRYEVTSITVQERLENDIMQTVRPWIEALLEEYPILFYNGQFDMIAAHSSTEMFLSKLHWSGAFNYSQARQQKWLVDGSVAGYYRYAANLVYVMVRNAGHMVPADQPRNSLDLIDMFVGKLFRE